MLLELNHLKPTLYISGLLLLAAFISFLLEFVKKITITALIDTRTYVTGKYWTRVPHAFTFALLTTALLPAGFIFQYERADYPITLLLAYHENGIVKNPNVDPGRHPLISSPWARKKWVYRHTGCFISSVSGGASSLCTRTVIQKQNKINRVFH